MRKLIFFMLVIFSLNGISEASVSRIDYRYEHAGKYRKGNISPKELPKAIVKYLEKNYPDYTILLSKRKNNGNYFVKIRFDGDGHHPYYRSLVFDSEGRVIKK
ncbi:MULTISPECIES: hypothetical protein [Parabacteroides]|uniref:hypothetical protein n=1 Tax=Parabacteroides TaxID=375288 RepID=UPI00240D36C2|nr:hypothetical protein [Parabacteroides chongii]WFE86907.1 hypothetical protein P3L47_10095 [Parabacteroides chongii]